MTDWQQYFTNSTIRFIDHGEPSALPTAMASFAVDDALAISVGNRMSPTTVRFWVHDPTIVLGIPDARLPYVKPAIDWLHSQDYRTVVRNSGGLAVVLDEGVLNMSLILPNAKHVGIHDGYDAMVQFIKHIFNDLTDSIDAFEVVGSYCPGDYDLSINGKKFAGISQRRVKNGSAVQIYLCVEGDGAERASLVKEFYRLGLQGEKGKFDYPIIEPDTMQSLSQLLKRDLTVADVKDRIVTAINNLANDVRIDDLNEDELVDFQKRMEQMIDRNDKALGDLT
ncbi:lipoate--protein ligase family protein [Aquibacillus kalidii]|uniref:lipoate--protein ligase family protein n=1 Tax=Aquibacillus kalidii TaxID=2762597 RepID=UPI001645776C|nr:lipoate--protein ligase family protein [Aquibacillus kalidii]